MSEESEEIIVLGIVDEELKAKLDELEEWLEEYWNLHIRLMNVIKKWNEHVFYYS